MATAADSLAQNLSFANFSKATDLKKRLWFTIGALIVFRLCSFVPLPGIDPQALDQLFTQTSGGMLDFFNMFSGGALERMSIIALGIIYAPRLARIVRGSTLVLRELPYIEAAVAMGLPTWQVLTRHVLLNLASPILVQATFVFASAMLAEASLSFLGVGVSTDMPTWGTMLASGREFMNNAPWLMVFPGLAIVFSVLSLQLLGDGLRDLVDPRLAKES